MALHWRKGDRVRLDADGLKRNQSLRGVIGVVAVTPAPDDRDVQVLWPGWINPVFYDHEILEMP